MTDALRLTVDGPVARIAIARPGKRNAIDQAMWEAFPHLIAAAISERGVRALVIESAEPGIFSAGADIDEFARKADDPSWQNANRTALRATQLAIAGAPLPTIAVVDGDCVGAGCGLALACDLRIASSRARFGITPAKLGLVYPLHDTRLLVDLVGPGQAKRLLYTGALLSADEALIIGLVEACVPVAELAGEVDGLLTAIVGNSPFTAHHMKGFVQRIVGGMRDDDAETTAIFDSAFTGPHFAEGVSAFKARRKPAFPDL